MTKDLPFQPLLSVQFSGTKGILKGSFVYENILSFQKINIVPQGQKEFRLIGLYFEEHQTVCKPENSKRISLLFERFGQAERQK